MLNLLARFSIGIVLMQCKDINFILGNQGVGVGVGEKGKGEQDEDGGGDMDDQSCSSANTVTDADLDDDEDGDDEEGEEGDDWEEHDKGESALGGAMNLFGLKVGNLDDIYMEQEPFSFLLKSGERSFVNV